MATARKHRYPLFKLDASKSAKENLWGATVAASRIIISHKHLKLTDDEWKELVDDLALTSVTAFMKNLRAYNRQFTFWQNVFARVYSNAPFIITRHLRRIQRHIESIHELNNLLTTDAVLYLSKSDSYLRYKVHPASYKTKQLRQRRYEEYLDCCAEFDIEAMSFEDYWK